jgi:pimeloyl-ACP methyl ester carboxylesterase
MTCCCRHIRIAKPEDVMLHTLNRDGVTLHYVVEGTGPVLVLTGAPVGITGFAALAARLAADFTVVRHDPRGIGQSVLPAGAPFSLLLLADDLHAIITQVTAEPALVFGASGGAVVGIDLLTRFPSSVRRLIIHEPPLFGLSDGGADMLARADEAFRLALDDPDAGVQAFSDLTEAMHETLEEHPRPASIVLPPLGLEDREKQRFALGRMAPVTVHYRPLLETIPMNKLVVAAGAASIGQPARKAAEALARRLDLHLHEAPGNHIGMALRVDAFAEWLQPLLLA